MLRLSKIITYLIAAVAVVYGCSPPEGGYREPTPADNVHYANYVVVGEVTDLLRPDPMFGDTYDSTYGAMVDVKCTYKGGPLPARIKIGGAGFIPGFCTSMDLQKGKEYILFLLSKRKDEDMYEQTETAAPKEKLMEYLRVCDLKMEYPTAKGMVLKRGECPPASKLDSCQRHGDNQTSTDVTMTEKESSKPRTNDIQGQNTEEERQSQAAGKKTTPDDDVNAAVAIVLSSATAIFSLLFVCL